MTKEFAWTELPERDETGSLTMTGWIKYSQKYFEFAGQLLLSTHTGNWIVRLFTNPGNGVFYGAWMPFDWHNPPGYVFVMSIQVNIMNPCNI